MAMARPDLGTLIDNLDAVFELRPDASPVEVACVGGVPETDLAATFDFVRKFQHQDWVDGESLVQAGKTPDEAGFNERFHDIEQDLDSLGQNVKRAFLAVAALRAQLRVCLNEIVVAMNAGNKNESKDTKDNKDTPDAKGQKDTKDTKDHKDTPDQKHTKDNKENKESKESKDSDDKEPKGEFKDGLGAIEKKDADGPIHIPAPFDGINGIIAELEDARRRPPPGPPLPDGMRVFIGPDERPILGERALNEPRSE